MKAIYEQVSATPKTSFIHKFLEVPSFDTPFHFHPQLELTWIVKGSGIRYVGRSVLEFAAGDLVLLGPNLPHCWINQKTEENVTAHVIQFERHFLGKDFFKLPEMTEINALFDRSKSGFLISNPTRKIIQEKIIRLSLSPPVQKISCLLEILQELANSTNLNSLDESIVDLNRDLPQTARFNQVISYLIQNYRQEIKLSQVAELVHMTPTSFCRYFKGIMKKTLVEVLLEFRIKHACQLLATTDYGIGQIASESGFSDLPYFNRQFKKLIGSNPMAYRKALKTKPTEIKQVEQ
jgi:AraC-like DNA-binding protein/mannose-6-phosphate isomerase-like protein (cupin superfamily)